MVCTKLGMNRLEITSVEARLRKWLDKISLEKSNIVVISRLSKNFEKNVTAYIKEKFRVKPLHFFSFHLSLDHAASLALSEKKEYGNFKNLTSHRQLIFLHDVDDVSSIRQFIGEIRSTLEKEAKSTVILTMRPAATYKVYKGTQASLYGRVVKVEEPTLHELGIKNKDAEECGFLDLYKAYSYDDFNKEKAAKNPESASFNVLSLFWYFLTNDSRKAGSVRVVSSCIAYHDKPLTISEINKKCGIQHGRQAVHAALKTRLMGITKDKPKRAYIYPPLLKLWIKTNVPFYPIQRM